MVLALDNVVTLSTLGLNPSNIKFSTTSLDSPYFLTQREEIDGVKTVSILDLRSSEPELERHKMGAEMVRMHPSDKIIALKADTALQVYNLAKGQRVHSAKLPAPISYIKWISTEVLAVITSSSVYHLSLSSSEPQKVFELSEPMKSVQILNYSASHDLQWLCVSGMTQDASRNMIGRLQLFSQAKGATQNLEGSAASFTSVSKNSNTIPIFCFVVSHESSFKFNAIPLGSTEVNKTSVEIMLDNSGDFPIAVHTVSSTLAYVITKTFCYLIDISNGETIDKIETNGTLFSSTVSQEVNGGQGIIATSSLGVVSLITADTSSLIKSCLDKGMMTSAISLASTTSRTSETLELFKNYPSSPGKPPLLLLYFHHLIENNTRLNQVESFELIKILVKQSKLQILEKYLREEKVTPTEELGDFLYHHDSKLGLAFYLKAQAHEKVVKTFISLELFDKIFQYSQRTGFLPDYPSLIIPLIKNDPDKALNLAKTSSNQTPTPTIDDCLDIADAFFKESLDRHATDYVLDVLENKPEEEPLQTRLIEANFAAGNITVVEKILSKGLLSHYDSAAVAKLCESHGLYHLALQHFENNDESMTRVIESAVNHGKIDLVKQYCFEINQNATPFVIKSLLNMSHNNDDVINHLLTVINEDQQLIDLIEAAESANRLKILLPFLESCVSQGNTLSEVHTALAKIYILNNTSAIDFLRNNHHYDPLVVGEFAENRDPKLAFEAYRKGYCDDHLLYLANHHDLMKPFALYVVSRQEESLWAMVLSEDNTQRERLVSTIVNTVVPNTEDQDEVSVAVRAFMKADLPEYLIELLEKIVLQKGGPFSNITGLQNLLILTAIKTDNERVAEYVKRLDNYDAKDIATIAIKTGLYDEAFMIYKKHEENSLAVSVLLDYMDSLEQATEFAERTGDPAVFAKLGYYLLENGQIEKAIETLIKANDGSRASEVIKAAQEFGCYGQLLPFLKMARQQYKDSFIDSEYAFCLGVTESLIELDDLLSSSSSNVKWIDVGDRLFDEDLFDACKLIFSTINQHAKLAKTLIKLGEFTAAVDAARKANSVQIYKEVCHACIDKGEFKLAQSAALNIISHPEELDPLVEKYVQNDAAEEVIQLLETASGLNKAHVGIFTVLGELYAEHRPSKLMEHIKIFAGRFHSHRLLTACKDNELWSEVVVIYKQEEEFESACEVMMTHQSAFEHITFKDFLAKSANVELYYKAVQHYLDNSIDNLSDLLCALPRIDKARVISLIKDYNQLETVKGWLVYVQDEDDDAINQALIDLYISEGDYEAVQNTVENFAKIDLLSLARRLQDSEIGEFRTLSAFVFSKIRRFDEAIELLKLDENFEKCISTAATSQNSTICQNLVRFFVENHHLDHLSTALHHCFDYLPPDFVLQLAWEHKLFDNVMPFMIRVTKTMSDKINELTKFKEATEAKLNDLGGGDDIFENSDEQFNRQFTGGFGFD
ncbi:hypothetical protein P9112_000583 [Eukaryota sp. TZLM1-RC]